MTYKKILPYITLFTLCLLISLAGGQDYLGGGYVGPYGGDMAQYFTDPIFSPNQQQSGETMYYPYFGAEFFRDYAYPYQYRNGIEQSPAATTGDSTATIVSKGMRGYQVFLDGNYIGTEGTGGDPLDGKFSFRVAGNQNHDIRVYDGQFNYPKTMFFERGGTKIINVEPGTAVYV